MPSGERFFICGPTNLNQRIQAIRNFSGISYLNTFYLNSQDRFRHYKHEQVIIANYDEFLANGKEYLFEEWLEIGVDSRYDITDCILILYSRFMPSPRTDAFLDDYRFNVFKLNKQVIEIC